MGKVLEFKAREVSPVVEPVVAPVRVPMSPVSIEDAYRMSMADFDEGRDLVWERTETEDGGEVWRAGQAALAIDGIVDVIKSMLNRTPFPPKK